VFITIGERINATRKNIREAIAARDAEAIRNEAIRQSEAGATILDINGGTRPEEELENLGWLIDTIAPAINKPFCVDSANPENLSFAAGKIVELSGIKPPESGMDADGAPWLTINSISAEKERYDGVLPIVIKYRASVVALSLDDSGMPQDAEQRITVGRGLIKRLISDGVPEERIFADPLIMPVALNTDAGAHIFRTVRTLREEFPGIHLTCGLTNSSHGLPARTLLNRTFLVMMVANGLDSAILDTTDRQLMAALKAALVFAGRDPYCADFISAFRNKLLDV